MGFFSDLKEDLSQAVNELMPEELMEQPADEMVEEAAGDSAMQETEASAAAADEFSLDISLEEMLKNIDDIQISEEPEAETDLEAALAEVLEGIPDESGVTENTFEATDAAWMYQASQEAEEVVEEAEEEVPVIAAAMEVEMAQVIEEKEDEGADNKMDQYINRQATDETAVITAGMQIKGNIMSEGSVDVVGTVEGDLDIWGKLNVTGHINGNARAAEIYAEDAKITGEIVSDGAVKIGNGSVIIGNITAKSAAIAGAVKGDIDVQGPVILDASAIVMGNIKSKSVQINNGAVIEGMCSQCYADVSPLSFFDEYKAEFKNSKKNK